MIDIVYVYGNGLSEWRGQELKYSLRSVEKFVKNYNNIYIIGDKPVYLNDKIIHIPKEDSIYSCKSKRIYEKLLIACDTKEISEEFVFYNDDFYHLNYFDVLNIPYYYDFSIEERIKIMRKTSYLNTVKNTLNILKENNLPTKFFDIHFPICYNKNLFKEVMTKYDWEIRSGYIIKSLYSNTLKIEGIKRNDIKIYGNNKDENINEKLNNADFFSTYLITRKIVNLFNEYFPNKSSYEM